MSSAASTLVNNYVWSSDGTNQAYSEGIRGDGLSLDSANRIYLPLASAAPDKDISVRSFNLLR